MKKMVNNTLQERLLEAPFIISKFVINEDFCNYERYLTELLNCSVIFMNITEGEYFKLVDKDKQYNGECDAVTSKYSLDYKLFVTSSTLQGLRETSRSITKIREGAFAFGISRMARNNAGKTFKYINTISALRNNSIIDFERILEEPKDKIEKEISIILKNLNTQKNLFLFYPYVLCFSEKISFDEGCNTISDVINEDLGIVRLYREQVALNFDTFLNFVYDNKLLIFQDNRKEWELKECVDMFLSKEYTELCNYCS